MSLLKPPRSLDIASRIYFLLLIGSSALAVLGMVFWRWGLLGAWLPVVVVLFTLQFAGTFLRTPFAAMLSGLSQLGVALSAAIVFFISVLFLFAWPPAGMIAFGALMVGYAAYWMAWQNWVWVQRLRGIEEERITLPRTLSIFQIMILTAVAAVIFGVASMAHSTFEQGP